MNIIFIKICFCRDSAEALLKI